MRRSRQTRLFTQYINDGNFPTNSIHHFFGNQLLQPKSLHTFFCKVLLSTQLRKGASYMWTMIRESITLLLLFWHFTGVMLWLSPDCTLKSSLISPFIGYLNFFGLWQGWSVFEKQRAYNGYLTAEVKFQDGSKTEWEFPRMEKLSITEKMFKEKYRRWTNDVVSDESKAYLWPDTARYIARLHRSPDKQPVEVAIIRHWEWIAPPGQSKSTNIDGQNTLYKGPISAEDLI